MTWKLKKESFIWAAGVIAITAVSNAAWEFAIKPFLLSTQNALLTLVTLGIGRLKDEMYIEIAKSHYDRASEGLFVFSLGMIATFLVLANVLQHVLMYISRRAQAVEEMPTQRSLIPSFLCGDRGERILGRLVWFVTGCVMIVVLLSITVSVQLRYINSAVNYYDQLITISSPFLTDEKYKIIASRYAQIKSGSEYEQVISDLRLLLKNMGSLSLILVFGSLQFCYLLATGTGQTRPISTKRAGVLFCGFLWV